VLINLIIRNRTRYFRHAYQPTRDNMKVGVWWRYEMNRFTYEYEIWYWIVGKPSYICNMKHMSKSNNMTILWIIETISESFSVMEICSSVNYAKTVILYSQLLFSTDWSILRQTSVTTAYNKCSMLRLNIFYYYFSKFPSYSQSCDLFRWFIFLSFTNSTFYFYAAHTFNLPCFNYYKVTF
jgi:hypothetical protein